MWANQAVKKNLKPTATTEQPKVKPVPFQNLFFQFWTTIQYSQGWISMYYVSYFRCRFQIGKTDSVSLLSLNTITHSLRTNDWQGQYKSRVWTWEYAASLAPGDWRGCKIIEKGQVRFSCHTVYYSYFSRICKACWVKTGPTDLGGGGLGITRTQVHLLNLQYCNNSDGHVIWQNKRV